MNKKQFLIIAVLLAVPFSAYFFLNPNLFGFDTYYHLDLIHNIANDSEFLSVNMPFLQDINAQIVLIKLTLYLLALCSVLIVAKTAELYHKNGWLAGLFTFLSPLLVFEFAKFENDQFAFPILFAANYFLLKGILEKSLKHQIIAFLLVCFAGLIWKGSIYYLIFYAFVSMWFILPAIVSILVFRINNVVGNFTANNLVLENTFFDGIKYLGAYCPLVLGIFLTPVVNVLGTLWLFTGIINAKFLIHSVPFLSIGALTLFNNKNLNSLDKKYKKPIWAIVKKTLIGCVILLPFVYAFGLSYAQPPRPEHFNIVDEWVGFQEQGFDTKNDWAYGYWIKYRHGNPTAWGGGTWEQDYNSGIILTWKDLNCEKLNSFKEMKLFNCD